MPHVLICILGFVFCMSGTEGAILFPAFISSSMVVQRGKPFLLWGTDAPQAVVNATMQGSTYTSTADGTGIFRILLPAQSEAAIPRTIVVSSSSGASAELSDVLFGDVFVFSGQSNMQLTVSWCYNYATKVAESAQHGGTLRIAQVALQGSYFNTSQPQSNLTLHIPWSRAGPANIAGMSAIAYFTALEMVRAHPAVPIGAIASAWGGTTMEPWMPPDAFAACAAQVRESNDDRGTSLPRNDPGLYHSDRHPVMELQAGPPSMRSTLWNSMVAPLLSLHVSGFYWYQGESNVGQASFAKCFPAMITSWRAHFNAPSAPFIFFQLGPWPLLDSGALPAQRQAQARYSLSLPNVGMIVAADRGDAAGAFHPIHPPVKEELSYRAFLVTDRLVYKNSSSPMQGPQVLKAIFDPWSSDWGDYHFGTGLNSYVCRPGSGFLCGGIRVQFDQPLVLASIYGDRNSYDNGLLLWDSSMTKYQRAAITGIRADAPDTLQLNTTWTFGEAPPATLQYAHADYPNMPIYNTFRLPAPPFQVLITSRSSSTFEV